MVVLEGDYRFRAADRGSERRPAGRADGVHAARYGSGRRPRADAFIRREMCDVQQEMEFRLLGPLEVIDGGARVALPAGKPRALLAILLLLANEAVSGDRLIDELWNGRPPVSARKVLQTYVWNCGRCWVTSWW